MQEEAIPLPDTLDNDYVCTECWTQLHPDHTHSKLDCANYKELFDAYTDLHQHYMKLLSAIGAFTDRVDEVTEDLEL